MKRIFRYPFYFTILPILLLGLVLLALSFKMSYFTSILAITFYLLVIFLPIILPLACVFIITFFPKLLSRLTGVAGLLYIINTCAFILMTYIFNSQVLGKMINIDLVEPTIKKAWTALIFISYAINLFFTLVNAFFIKLNLNRLLESDLIQAPGTRSNQ